MIYNWQLPNWQLPNWPYFEFNHLEVEQVLYDYALETSALSGAISQLSQDLQSDTLIELMVAEAIKTSEIEGEILNTEDVRSSIRHQLGLLEKTTSKDPRANGVGMLMISVRKTFLDPLSKEMLFDWHNQLMSDPSQREKIDIGKWRSNPSPMQIISGPIGQEKVFFEAPPYDQVDFEMNRFIQWFNDSLHTLKGPIRSAVAHLYFESIHPFEDGNGRIGRAIVEKALSQELKAPVLLSLSTTIQKKKNTYYEELSKASSSLHIGSWIYYFVHTIYQAQLDAKESILHVLKKSMFWKRYGNLVNERQEKALNRMFREGPKGFEGGLSAQKYMNITQSSKATATRDLTDLLEKGCLYKLPGEGRSTRYQVLFIENYPVLQQLTKIGDRVTEGITNKEDQPIG
jgi:Fic family protein